MYHYCTLAFYGKAPVGNISCFDGEVLTLEAAQGTIQNIEQKQQSDPAWVVETPYGPCKPIRAYMQGGEQSGRIIWQLEQQS